ncbi:MAG: hypothetical protein OIF58_17090, partial [Cohaesibacter sp.]|nr:hypothetical protein [Cohaesibacter sp.]
EDILPFSEKHPADEDKMNKVERENDRGPMRYDLPNVSAGDRCQRDIDCVLQPFCQNGIGIFNAGCVLFVKN